VDLRAPFRGSDAVAAGLVTEKVLRGPRFRRLFAGIYVAADVDVDLALRARAAFLLVDGHGVVGGHAAAELLGASCGPRDGPVEVVVPARGPHGRPGIVVRNDRLSLDEVARVDGIAVTSPLRTAFDLARRPPLVEAVVAVDALAHEHGFDPQELVRVGYRHPNARGVAQLPAVVRLVNPMADSPMETRIRFALVQAGLPCPVLQHPVGPYLLDLAYPDLKLAIEYDGREHLIPERALHDLRRQAYLTRAGWEVLRFPAATVLGRPGDIPRAVMIALKSLNSPS
jgi:very-short-patch-repair endonuclease